MSITVAVIGAGITGLTAAWELRRRLGSQVHILVLESYDRLGGKLKTVDLSDKEFLEESLDFPVDMGAEAFRSDATSMIELINAVGLGDAIVSPSSARSALWIGGELVDIPSDTIMGIPATADSVKAVLSPEGYRRVAKELEDSPLSWIPGDDVNVGQCVGARLGQEVVDRLLSPLLGGVYSTGAEDLGLRATIPQIAETFDQWALEGREIYLQTVVGEILHQRRTEADENAENTQGLSIAQPKSFFSALSCGFGTLVDALAEQSGATILKNTSAESIGRVEQGYYVDPIGIVDAVLIATPAPTAAELMRNISSDVTDILGGISLASSAVVGMALDNHDGIPERSGILLGTNAGTHAKAFTFSSRKWPHIAEHGAFIRASFGTYRDTKTVELDDDTLVSYALRDLEAITGHRFQPYRSIVQRWWGGLPRYGVGHHELMALTQSMMAGIPRIELAGSVFEGVGLPSCVASAHKAAARLAADL